MIISLSGPSESVRALSKNSYCKIIRSLKNWRGSQPAHFDRTKKLATESRFQYQNSTILLKLESSSWCKTSMAIVMV